MTRGSTATDSYACSTSLSPTINANIIPLITKPQTKVLSSVTKD
jgi:hypothetical protein